MSFNLQRDAKVYVSEVATGFTSANTFEVRPMSGFSFNQTTTTQDISVDEAGATPSRGSKRFNTALNPTDLSFSTYIRPYKAGANHDCPERILWEALVGNDTFGTNAVSGPTNVLIDFNGSNVHELKKLYIFVDYGNAKYRIDEAVMGQAEIGFDIQGIAMIAWTGNGKLMTEVETVSSTTFPQAGSFAPVPDCADFIKNKLSTISLVGSYDRTRAYQVITITDTAAVSASTPVTFNAGAGTYTFTIVMDGGVAQTISYVADGATDTLGGIVDAINLQLRCGTLVVTYVGLVATLTFYSTKYGTSGSVSIVDVNMLAQIHGDATITLALAAAVAGTSA